MRKRRTRFRDLPFWSAILCLFASAMQILAILGGIYLITEHKYIWVLPFLVATMGLWFLSFYASVTIAVKKIRSDRE